MPAGRVPVDKQAAYMAGIPSHKLLACLCCPVVRRWQADLIDLRSLLTFYLPDIQCHIRIDVEVKRDMKWQIRLVEPWLTIYRLILNDVLGDAEKLVELPCRRPVPPLTQCIDGIVVRIILCQFQQLSNETVRYPPVV